MTPVVIEYGYTKAEGSGCIPAVWMGGKLLDEWPVVYLSQEQATALAHTRALRIARWYDGATVKERGST